MPSLTMKNIPEPLYDQLKATASAHHRSINSELMCYLEQMLLPQKFDAAKHIQHARELRSTIPSNIIEPDHIQDAIKAGRT